jgi:hypothetical protein
MAHLATLFQACTAVKQGDVCSYELQALDSTSRCCTHVGSRDLLQL